MAQRIIRHELVSVLIPANSTQTRFLIPDLPNLRNVHLFGIQVYTVDQVFKDVQTQNPVLSHTAVLHNSFLTFVNYGGKEFLKQAPSIMFNTISANLQTSTNWFENNTKSFVGQKVNYPKSYIEFTAAPATAVDTVYLMSVYYSLPEAEERKESGYSFSKKA
jgi:hypothetical protein